MPASEARIRVMIVDDHPVLREGIAALLESQADLQLVAEATNGEEALQRFRELRPDVTLMDLQMPGMGGIDAIAAIRREFPAARIAVLTTYSGDVQALRAFQSSHRSPAKPFKPVPDGFEIDFGRKVLPRGEG